MEPTEYIWQNGEFVLWDEARVHVLTHGLHYGTGVFEGIRCYNTDKGPAIFRAKEHYDRLHRSGELYYMEIPYSTDQLRAITKELITKNGLRACYIRPTAFRGYGEMGLFPLNSDVETAIAVWEWASYLGEKGKAEGIRAKISSWRRMSPSSFIPQAKANGQYLNSVLAKVESHKAGYDEAIMLDENDYVCEGSGENIFVIRDGTISTPPMSASILEGISRDAVMQIARDMGYELVERNISRSELFIADEVFMTGTAAELTPLREIDDHKIGEPGEITRALQAKFEDALHGRAPEYLEWLDFVEVNEPATDQATTV
jgi:branched-chain amino acid aminotransferase